ncbi:T9SS type A sorting domain-containing protein [Algibacter mikhailovii]|uniref:Secretion system C-terminal sorting domain-containing protein n=1 Tax=Algibacter mikhailovii TaxID=425498 RepID=A0A918V9V9_9FLAO|nr:T9SS type A sorting domain-containing protein [Algibacter mikhailovii]GGZ83606.1 hypothetical protein GCM10007028_22050 [Algibacter mikhailovii]
MKKIYAIMMFVALVATSMNVSAQSDAVTITDITIEVLDQFYAPVSTHKGVPQAGLSDDISGISINVEELYNLEITMTVNSNNTSNVERAFVVGKKGPVGDGTQGNWTNGAYNDIQTPGAATSYTMDRANIAVGIGNLGENFLRLSAKIYNDGANESTGPNDGANSGWMAAPLEMPLFIFAEGTLSTSDKNAFKFAMYPNPVKDRLNINTQETISNVSVVDMLGRVVLSVDNVVDNLDVSSLKNAMYIVKLTSDKGVSTKRFIKN